MVVDERSRHELYRRLEEVLGPEAATTLIEHLPPVGWADVATKHDLAGLEERLDLRFDRLDDRFERVDDRFARVDDRFDRIDGRFTALDDRFDRIDDRFTALDDRFTSHISAAVSDLRATFEHEMRLQTITFGQEVRSQTNTSLFALVGVVLTMAALAFALVRFT